MSEESIEAEPERKKALHERWQWLDQFRGLKIIFLIISVISWQLSGDPLNLTDRPIGPPLLNHGFQYLDGYPALITIIDIGQQIFIRRSAGTRSGSTASSSRGGTPTRRWSRSCVV